LDGELLRDGRMIVWDFAFMGQAKSGIPLYVCKEPYLPRLEALQKMIPKRLIKDRFSFEVIQSLPLKEYKSLLLKAGDKNLEGLVLKKKLATDLWGISATRDVDSQLKYRF
jgi:hypothetical protein